VPSPPPLSRPSHARRLGHPPPPTGSQGRAQALPASNLIEVHRFKARSREANWPGIASKVCGGALGHQLGRILGGTGTQSRLSGQPLAHWAKGQDQRQHGQRQHT
jgi:hypothetical protein